MTEKYTSRQERRQKQKQDKPSSKKDIWKKILMVTALLFAILFIVAGITIISTIRSAPALEADDLKTPHSTVIYDQDKEFVTTVFREENRVRSKIDEIPDEVKDAVISIEDKRFYDHKGVDFRRIFGATLANIKHGWGSEGGSTITQQVIKQSVLTPEKTLTRKIQEAWLALKLERHYSKDEILEMYLNNIYFGQRAYGIQTAAETYFNKKDLNDLSLSQTALLAGLPNAPSAYDPTEHPDRAEKRRNQVLAAMVSNGAITKEEADKAKEESIADIIEPQKKEDSSPYNAFVDTVYEQLVHQDKIVTEEEFFQDGLEIYTTLDAKAQKTVYDILQSEDIPYPDQDFETGIALVDTETGAVQAIGGGRNFKAISYKNYGSDVQHHPGSTIKPILDYAPAIEHLNWSTAQILNDEPYQYSDGTPIHEWDNQYWGSISMRRALEWSRNIPALKALQATGLDKAQSFAKGLGIDIDPMNESAALGSFDKGASPLQMAEAYAAFGNGGTYNKPYTVKEIVFPDGSKLEPKRQSKEAMQDYTAYMITDMLKSVINSGTGTQANVDGIPVAGKTGSTNIPAEDKQKYGISDGLLDAWFAGYTPKHSLAVWTGYPSFKNKDGDVQYIKNDGTQNIAKRIFKELMTDISDPEMSDFEKPDSVVVQGSELYVRGMEPAQQPPQEQQEDTEEQEAPENDEPEEEEENNDEDEVEEEEEEEEEPEEDNAEENQENEENNEGTNEENNNNQEENESDNGEDNQQDQNNSNQNENESNTDNQSNGSNGSNGNNNDNNS